MLMKRNILIIFISILIGFLGSTNTNAQCSASITLADTIKCFGDYATINIITVGGGGWYNYDLEYEIFGMWFTLSTQNTYDTATFTNLPANNYRVTVTDTLPGGCTALAFINISQPPNLLPAVTIASPSLCFGDSIAEIDVNITGGTPPVNVTVNGGPNILIPYPSNAITIDSLPAGTYQLRITDSNGCEKNRIRTIISPPALVPNSIIQSNYNGYEISCFGANDGAIRAQVNSGGTPGFMFAINQVNNPLGVYTASPDFQNLSSGTYAIQYIDTNGCTTSDTLLLREPPDLSGTISVSSAISCNSVCDGQITFSVDPNSPGIPTYQYSLNGGAYQTGFMYGALCGDNQYFVTVLDFNGCTYTDSIYLTQPDSLDVYASVISNYNGWGVSCFGVTNGAISVDSVNGGTPTYTYSIDNGPISFSSSFTGLSGGNHTIVVHDASSCTQPVNITISEPNYYSIALTTNVNYNGFDVACNGDCNGSINISSTGGVSPYLYSLNGGGSQTSSNFNGQCANALLTIDATDANGCLASDSILLIEPLVMNVQMDSVLENCGNGDGQASATVGGGVSPYFYLWSDGQITSTAINLTMGMHTVIITDANGCSITDSIFVPGTDMVFSTTKTNVSCHGENDGTATITVIGTYASPLTFQWNDPNFQNSATATGLTAGTYIVTVTDANGCSMSDTIDVAQPDLINLELDSANSFFEVPCFGDSLGIASVSATGGSGPGTYWFYIDALNPQNDSTFYGLPTGNYRIFVTDANICVDSVEVQILEPAELTFTLSSTDVLCFGGISGTAEIATISGGTPLYLYNWSNGATTDSIGGLSIGNYWVTVTDSNGCTIYPPDTVTINEPTLLTTSVTSTSSMCGGTIANGTAAVVASGGMSPYTYLWNTGATTSNITLLIAGTYTVIVTDYNGCQAYDTIIVQVGPNPSLGNNLVTNISCFGASDGYLVPFATGGTTPLTFSINGSLFTYSIGDTIGPSGPASYWLTVRDSNGCVESDSIIVQEPALLTIDYFSVDEVDCYGGSDGEITVNHSGGTPGYSYNWSNLQTSQTAIGLSIGTFFVVVTDTNGCVDSSVNITMTQPDSLYITSIISTDVLCNGGNDGSATVTTSGGVTPYSYLWSNNAITQTAFMSAGNYNVDVTDSNGCIVNGNITVYEPLALVVDSFVMDSVLCLGFSDGSAHAYVSGGVLPYSYLWENGDNTALADSLNAGYHSVTITDFNNCTHVDSVEVLQPATSVSIDSLIINQITCKNASNGSIVVLATGGTPFYTYSKDGGANYQTAIGFIGLSPAIYNIMVKDNNGCTTTTIPVTITEPDSLLIDSVVFHHISCNGYNNGYIQSIAVRGGIQPYLYSVNGSTPQQNLSSFNNYSPGSYTVEVFDNHNCVVADIIIIEEPQILTTTITTSDYNGYEIKCNGDNTGSINVNVSGGIGPYLKTWINAQGSILQSSNAPSVNNLIAGLYNLKVLDANACLKSEFITMTEPDPIQHDFVVTHVTCDGWANGSITDSIYGGVPGYTYLWDTGNSADTTHTITNLLIGTYDITVTDENNCTSDASATVNDNDKLDVNVVNVQDVSCYGYCNGSIEVNISGGMPFYDSFGNEIYTNLWDDPLSQIDPTAIGLCADPNTLSTNYTIIITDAIGCVVTESAAITQPSELEVTAIVLDEVSCYSGNDGKLKATAVGGTPSGSSYTYDWNTGTTTTGVFSTLSNLGTGSYVVIATDNNGCMDTTEIYLAEPTDLSVTVSSTNVSCHGFADGSITANPTGGTPISPSGTYTYSWSDGQITQTATGLAPGLYSVTVTDANGCSVSSSNVMITQSASPLIVTADSTDETCAMDNGIAIANVFGGTPPYINYLWSSTGQTTQTATGLSPGFYTVTVTDRNGCIETASTYVNAVDAIFLPDFTENYYDTICLGESVTISVVEKLNHTYLWNTGQMTTEITVKPNASRMDYILSVTDPACPNNPFNVIATIWATQLPIVPYGIANGETYSYPADVPIKIKDDVVLGSAYSYPYYFWSTGATTKEIYVSPEVTTTYYVMVEDAQGCQGYDSIRVAVGVMVYDGISPNGDGYNDFWEIEDINQYPNAVIEVYNRWGALLFSAKGDTYNNNKWDGTHHGTLLPIGTYYYIINLNDDSDSQSGAITIVR